MSNTRTTISDRYSEMQSPPHRPPRDEPLPNGRWALACWRDHDLPTGASKVGERAQEAAVEYRLARNAVVREVKAGRRMKEDVCDAHPELLRAARNIGKTTGEDCPNLRRDHHRRGHLRLRRPPPTRRPVPGHQDRAQPAPAPGGARALLRRRGVPAVRLAPPHPQVPRRRAHPEGQADPESST